MRIEITVRRLCLLTLSLGLVRASAADYYVSTQGNDSNSGSAAQPFRTITRAYSLASAGTTITVLPGVYTDYRTGWGLHLNKNGTASKPITLRSQVRGQAIIDGKNLSDRNAAIYLDGSYNIIDGFQIRGGPKGGITIWGNYNQILNNDIHHNGNPASSSTLGQDGVYSAETTRNTVYRANYIHDNGRTGSNLDHALYLRGDNELIINNVLIRNAAYGLHIAGHTTVSNMKAYNNVMAHNGKSGIILWMALSGVDIKNNIIYQNGKYGIDSYDAHGSGVVIDRNLVFGNSLGNYALARDGSDFTYTLGTTISSAPLFVNSTSGGFDSHLRAGSPAINAAVNLSSTFTTDLAGAARPASGAWDLGAYKYGNTDTTPPTPSNGSGSHLPSSVVGTWEITMSGNDKGTAFLTFSPDSTLSGYGISENSFGLFTLTGTWSFDSKGRLVGSITEQLRGQSYLLNFIGTAKKGTKLQVSAVRADGSFRLKGIRAVTLPNLSGHYMGYVKQSGLSFTEVYDLNAASYPGVFNISGYASEGFTISGALIVSSRNLVNAYALSDFGAQGTLLSSRSGKTDPVKGTGKLKGMDQNGGKFTIATVRQ